MFERLIQLLVLVNVVITVIGDEGVKLASEESKIVFDQDSTRYGQKYPYTNKQNEKYSYQRSFPTQYDKMAAKEVNNNFGMHANSGVDNVAVTNPNYSYLPKDHRLYFNPNPYRNTQYAPDVHKNTDEIKNNKTVNNKMNVNNNKSQGNEYAKFATPLSESITGIGLDLMKVIDTSNNGNTAISPFSIALSLGVLQQAASGETQRQINNFIRLSPEQSVMEYQNLINLLRKRTSRNILSLATNLFIDKDFAVFPNFKQMALRNFASDVEGIDFKESHKAANHINDWISQMTNKQINQLVTPDAVGPGTQLLLANAIYFKGLWNATFNEDMTIHSTFHLQNGAPKDALFMQQNGVFKIGIDNYLRAQYLVLPFEGFQYAMVFIVPEHHTVSQVLQTLTTKDILRMTSSRAREGSISVPKFDLKLETDLTMPLMKLGVVDLFTSRSSLQGLGNPGSSPRVSGALHGAAISIDEHGGKAAAATAIAINTLSLADWNDEFHFKANKPFVLLLWDIEATLPLMIAKVADPTLPN